MESFNELLRGLDLEFFGNGKHKISFKEAMRLRREGDAFIIDVRTKEEINLMKFDFAYDLPLNELPDRVNEIPKDKLIILFCVSSTRSAIAFTYLRLVGYDNVKLLANGINEITETLKPGSVLKNS